MTSRLDITQPEAGRGGHLAIFDAMTTEELDAAQTDRAIGAVVGSAVADALGAAYEFDTRVLGPGEHAQMLGGGLGSFEKGEWTDDTVMAWCVLEAAATGLDLRSDEALTRIARSFRTWSESGPKDIGNQTARVLAAAGPSPTATDLFHAASELHRSTGHTGGNGSLMRTTPVPLPYLHDTEASAEACAEAADKVGRLTHWDEHARSGCVLWSLAIRHAILHADLDVRIGLPLIDPAEAAFWAERLDEAETRDPRTFNPNGWVVTALQAAWAAISQTPVPKHDPGAHYVDALDTAIRIGNDTDTVAAIAGGLLGARWGADAIPQQWRAINHGYPGITADALATLARHAVGAAPR